MLIILFIYWFCGLQMLDSSLILCNLRTISSNNFCLIPHILPTMTIRELRNLTRLKQLPDQWWLAVNNEVFEEKIRLIDLEMRQARLKNKEVYVLNADVAYLERDWTKVDFVGLHLYGKEKLPKTTQPKASTRSKTDPVVRGPRSQTRECL